MLAICCTIQPLTRCFQTCRTLDSDISPPPGARLGAALGSIDSPRILLSCIMVELARIRWMVWACLGASPSSNTSSATLSLVVAAAIVCCLGGGMCLSWDGSGDRSSDRARDLREVVGSVALPCYLYFADDSLLLWARSSGMAGLSCYRRDSNSGASGQRELGASQVRRMARAGRVRVMTLSVQVLGIFVLEESKQR